MVAAMRVPVEREGWVEADGAALRRLRGARAYSLRELADVAGVTQDNIWKIENGVTRRPHPKTVRKLADALGVVPDDLLLPGWASLIRQQRERVRLSQEALATKTNLASPIGLSLTALDIADYELGQHVPGREVIGPLTRALGIPAGALLATLPRPDAEGL